MFEEKENQITFNLVITLFNFWIGDLIFTDNYLLTLTVDMLDTLIKSSKILLYSKIVKLKIRLILQKN
jgi:hypothetical protein